MDIDYTWLSFKFLLPLTRHGALLRVDLPTRREVKCTLVFITSPLVGEVGSEHSEEAGEGLQKLK